jgi:hypothetical protein
VTLPVRAVGSELACAVTVSAPLPVAELFVAPGALNVIHVGESVVKAQLQFPELAETLTVFAPPFAVTLSAMGVTVYVHWPSSGAAPISMKKHHFITGL